MYFKVPVELCMNLLVISECQAYCNTWHCIYFQLSFNNFMKRVYLDRLTKAPLDPRFTFIDFEDAAIIIRSPGDVVHRSMKWEFKVRFSKKSESFETACPAGMNRLIQG